jgi:hypothetical protein
LNTILEQQCSYPFEEFMDHVRAMRTVRDWEYTQRFGHLGTAQNSRANGARVVEYFTDSYPNQKEAVRKAELFLSIYDYIGRNASFFGRKGLVEELKTSFFSVDPALLRAVHFVFTVPEKPAPVHHKRVWNLAKAFKDLEPVS